MAALVFEDNTEDTKDHLLFDDYSSVCLVYSIYGRILFIQFVGIQHRPQLTNLTRSEPRSPAVWKRVLTNKMAALYK